MIPEDSPLETTPTLEPKYQMLFVLFTLGTLIRDNRFLVTPHMYCTLCVCVRVCVHACMHARACVCVCVWQKDYMYIPQRQLSWR